jgi:pimeloyl-ACP methyl ester carboxylesterase
VSIIPIFKYDNIELFYINEGEGEPLVLISGWGDRMGWIFQIPYFKEKMNVITLHNRGTGKSSRPNYPYTMEMFLEDIKQLLKYLNITEKIQLCGWSMGGIIAQHYVLKYPETVKTLILIATTPLVSGAELDSLIEFHELIENIDLEQKLKSIIAVDYLTPFKKRLRADNELYEKIRKRILEYPTTLQDLKNQAAAVRNHDTRGVLHNILQPTLILVGEKDQLQFSGSSRILHEKLPNSRLEIIPNSAHQIVIEESEKVNTLIWEFIKEHL